MTVARAPFLAAQRGERIGIVGSQRRRQDDPAPDDRGRPAAARRDRRVRPPGRRRRTSPSCATPRSPARRSSTRSSRRSRSRPGEARGYLARFLFRGDDAFKEVRTLSGGERSRLELALLGILPSNLMLLDEPTNHLDIAAREAIEAFLARVARHAARRVPRPAAARDDLREAVGGRRRAGGAVRRRLPRVARRGRRRLDRAGRGAAAREPDPVGRGAADGRRRRPTARAATGVPAVAAAPPRAPAAAPVRPPAPRRRPSKARPKLSKDAYRRRREALDLELGRLGLRKSQLELSMGMPSVTANFVEMRRVTSELRTSSGRSPRPRTPGSSSRSWPRDGRRAGASRTDGPDRHHRAHRLRQVAGRTLARASAARTSSTPTRRRAP